MTDFNVVDDKGRDKGAVSYLGSTDDNAPSVTLHLSDVLSHGSTLVLSLDGSTVRTMTSGSTLSYGEHGLSHGLHNYSASIVDASGHATLLDLNGFLPGSSFLFTVT